MHILFLADASSPHSYRWIKYFSEIPGINITWCSFSKNTMPELDGVKYKILSKRNPLKLLQSIRYISSKSPDIIHAHYLGWNGLMSLFFPKAKIVLTAWGSDIVFNKKNFIYKFFIKKMIKKANVITCDAYHLKDTLLDLGSKKDKIKIIMFGIDEDLFFSKREPFHLKNLDSRYVVGSIRNLHPVYDVITLVRAAKEILKSRNDVIFNIAGSGPDLDYLEKFVEENNIQHAINFIGRLEQSQLLSFYNELDIYVSTSLSDGGIASSTAEAMLCGRPVVITNAAENAYWVKDKENGRLFDCGDVSGLAKIIIHMLDDAKNTIELGLNGKKTIIKDNSYKNEMKKMLDIYRSL